MLARGLAERRQVIASVAVPFSLFCDHFCHQLGVQQLISISEEGPDHINDFDCEQIIPEAVRRQDYDIIVLYSVQLFFTLCGIVAACAHLERKVELVLLLLGLEDLHEVEPILAQKYVTRIAQIASNDLRLVLVESSEHTS
jgi:hypothetical protein